MTIMIIQNEWIMENIHLQMEQCTKANLIIKGILVVVESYIIPIKQFVTLETGQTTVSMGLECWLIKKWNLISPYSQQIFKILP